MTRRKYSWEEDLQEDRAFARKVGWSASRWFLTIFFGLLVVSLVAGGLTWLLKVGLAEPKGAGDAHVQINSAANRLEAQKKYNQLYEGILAADKKITSMAANARSEFDRTNVQGATNVCLETVADYNRMAGDVLTAKWKPELLPARVGDDPTTDCLPALPTPTPAR